MVNKLQKGFSVKNFELRGKPKSFRNVIRRYLCVLTCGEPDIGRSSRWEGSHHVTNWKAERAVTGPRSRLKSKLGSNLALSLKVNVSVKSVQPTPNASLYSKICSIRSRSSWQPKFRLTEKTELGQRGQPKSSPGLGLVPYTQFYNAHYRRISNGIMKTASCNLGPLLKTFSNFRHR